MRYLFFTFLCAASLKAAAQPAISRLFQQDTVETTQLVYGFCAPLQPTADGGMLMTFYRGYPDLESQSYSAAEVLKLDGMYRPQWRRSGGAAAPLADGTTLIPLSSGYTDSACPIIEKVSSSGNTIWRRTLCSDAGTDLYLGTPLFANNKVRMAGICSHCDPDFIYGLSVITDVDTGGHILGAWSIQGNLRQLRHFYADDSGNYYFIFRVAYGMSVVKMRPDNSIAWQQVWDSNDLDLATLVALPNGDVLVGGNYRRFGTSVRIFLTKVSASGVVLWQKIADKESRVSDMSVLPNGNIAIAAGGQPVQIFQLLTEDNIIVIDTAAQVKWARNMDADRAQWPSYLGLSVPYVTGSNTWCFGTVTQAPYAATLFTTDSLGAGGCGTSVLVSIAFADTVVNSFHPDTVALVPFTIVEYNRSGTMPARYQPYAEGCDYVAVGVKQAVADELIIYPNPAKDEIILSGVSAPCYIQFYDLTGKLLHQQQTTGNRVDLSSLRPGYYTIRLTNKVGATTYKKLVIN